MESVVFFTLTDPSKKRGYKKRALHKVSPNSFFLRNELTNVNKVFEIEQYKQHFYVFNKSSELIISDLIDGSLYDCTDDTVLLEFDNIELIYMKNYLKSAHTNPRKYVFTIIDTYIRLLHSLELLVGKDVVHNHINFDTIVFHLECPLLLNFTYSIDVSRKDIDTYMKHFIVAYEPAYLEWALEFHILSYLLTNKLSSLSSYNIEHIITEVISHNSVLNTFGSTIVSLYKEEALSYFKKYVNRSYEYILTDMLQYSKTWDNYALSIVYLRILITIHKTIKIQNKFIILFMKLLVSNIHTNPLKRGTIETSQQLFQVMLDSLELKDYDELIHHVCIDGSI